MKILPKINIEIKTNSIFLKYKIILTQAPAIISAEIVNSPFSLRNLSLTKSLTVSFAAFSGATPISWGNRPR